MRRRMRRGDVERGIRINREGGSIPEYSRQSGGALLGHAGNLRTAYFLMHCYIIISPLPKIPDFYDNIFTYMFTGFSFLIHSGYQKDKGISFRKKNLSLAQEKEIRAKCPFP